MLLCVIWTTLRRLLTPVLIRLGVNRHWRRWLLWMAWLASLAIQGIMLHLLYELVELSIDLMEVWAELAAKHLEIQLDRS